MNFEKIHMIDPRKMLPPPTEKGENFEKIVKLLRIQIQDELPPRLPPPFGTKKFGDCSMLSVTFCI